MYGYNESATNGLSSTYNESATGGLSATSAVLEPPAPPPPAPVPQQRHSRPSARLMQMRRAPEDAPEPEPPVLIPYSVRIRCVVSVARRARPRRLRPVIEACKTWALRTLLAVPAGLRYEAIPAAVLIPGIGMLYERPFRMRWEQKIRVRGRIERDVRTVVRVPLESLEQGIYASLLLGVTDRP